MLSAFGLFGGGGGVGGGVGGVGGWGGVHVPSNTEYFNISLQVGTSMTCYPYSSPYLLLPLLLPLPTTTPTPPLTYYSPGAWSEVTSMVMYVMMTNSLIHYCQSMKHIYMDTVHKLS